MAGLARRAIKGLGTLLTQHGCLQYQSEADAAKVSCHYTPALLCSTSAYSKSYKDTRTLSTGTFLVHRNWNGE